VSRAERLLALIETLRRHRRPVGGAVLAHALGVSLRTLYRDVASLQAQGATIDGAPGLGYVLRPGFVLPPLMFAPDEIEALALGSQWVADRADERLGQAARNAMAKIAAVIPADLRHELETSALLVGPGAPMPAADANVALIRQAIRAERKLDVAYKDRQSRSTTRTVWPFALGFFDRVQVLVAFCELRDSVRHFRTDRIGQLKVLDARYPRRRNDLLKEWRAAETADRN